MSSVMPLHRKIIHDSDCDSPSPPPAVVDRCSRSPPKRSCTHEEGVVIILSSDNEEDAESLPVDEFGNPLDEFGNPQEDTPPRTTTDVQLAILSPLQFAGRFGRFPFPAECGTAIPAVDDDDLPLVQPAAMVVDADQHDGNLWNAVPPPSSQFMDLEAACMDDTSSGYSSDSDGELSPGFVSDCEAEKDSLSKDDLALLERFFPRTAKYVHDCLLTFLNPVQVDGCSQKVTRPTVFSVCSPEAILINCTQINCPLSALFERMESHRK